MKQKTALIIIGVSIVAGAGLSWLFTELSDRAHKEKAEEMARLETLRLRYAEGDSLLRADSLRHEMVTPDLAFHELHGQVRDVSSGEEHVSFDRNGVWTNPQFYISRAGNTLNVERNKLGRVVRAVSREIFEGEPTERIEYEWRDDRVYKIHSVTYDGSYDITYTYDNKGLLKESRVVSRGDGAVSDVATTYTYDKFDSNGNWTRRTAKSAIKTTEEEGYYDDSTETYVEGNEPLIQSNDEVQERKITYYEN